MSLHIFDLQSFLIDYEGYNIGYKYFTFDNYKIFTRDGVEYQLINLLDAHFGKLLLVQELDKLQSVLIRYKIVNNTNSIKDWKDGCRVREFKLGYCINQFKTKNIRTAFNCFGKAKYFNDIVLPVMFKNDWVQLVGLGDIVVSRFFILNADNYEKLCNLYNVRTKKDVLEFLKGLYKTYS
jgi:hypothetical protein